MPEETPEQKAAREAEEARDKRLMEGIAVGVREGLKPMMKEFQEREPAAPVRTEPVTTIIRPTEEQIAQAQVDGNATELARLLRLQRQADAQERQRELATLSAQGSAAIGSVAKGIAEQNPDYKRYKKEIDAEIATFQANNPGAIVDTRHLQIATDIVKARHIDEIVNERIEEQRRQQQEREQALLPDNEHHEERIAKEPKTLEEALDVPDWKLFKEKQRGVGGRTNDGELQRMGYRNGLPDFLAARKQMDTVESELGSGFGLDRDWSCKAHNVEGCRRCLKSNAEGEYIN